MTRTARCAYLLPCFPEIGACLAALPPLTLDGELVMLDNEGRPRFDPLQRRFRMKRSVNIAHAAKTEPAVLFAFDMLELCGKDLRRLPLLRRKAALEKVLKGSDRVLYVQHIGEEGERLFRQAEELGIEGVVAKPADSAYYRGRSSGWLKIKTSAGRAIDEERAKWNE
jgi:bifunctional non-homologous end joining protein LigD